MTGEIISVPGRRKTHLKPGKDLKDALHQPQSTEGEVEGCSAGSITES
jgi:hypothetical protein